MCTAWCWAPLAEATCAAAVVVMALELARIFCSFAVRVLCSPLTLSPLHSFFTWWLRLVAKFAWLGTFAIMVAPWSCRWLAAAFTVDPLLETLVPPDIWPLEPIFLGL